MAQWYYGNLQNFASISAFSVNNFLFFKFMFIIYNMTRINNILLSKNTVKIDFKYQYFYYIIFVTRKTDFYKASAAATCRFSFYKVLT